VSCAGRSSRSCKSSSLGSRLHNHRTLSRSRVGARVHRRKPHKQWAKVEPLSLHCQGLDQRHCSGKQELWQKPKPLSTASPSPSRCTSPRSGKPSTPYRSAFFVLCFVKDHCSRMYRHLLQDLPGSPPAKPYLDRFLVRAQTAKAAEDAMQVQYRRGASAPPPTWSSTSRWTSTPCTSSFYAVELPSRPHGTGDSAPLGPLLQARVPLHA
jgi:hypothetical protein